MLIHDFPERICAFTPTTSKVVVNVVIPSHLINHPTRVVTLMLKNRTDQDVYVKNKPYDDSCALRITAKEYEAIEFTAIDSHVDLQIWTLAAVTNGETIEVIREG